MATTIVQLAVGEHTEQCRLAGVYIAHDSNTHFDEVLVVELYTQS